MGIISTGGAGRRWGRVVTKSCIEATGDEQAGRMGRIGDDPALSRPPRAAGGADTPASSAGSVPSFLQVHPAKKREQDAPVGREEFLRRHRKDGVGELTHV